jgi:NADPH:quinone reductase-like Zn-dependent oxidoreductase
MRRLSHTSTSQAPPSPITLSSTSMTTPPTKPALSGQVALITGATGGIGAATARLLASHGCSVALHYNSDQDGALALQDEFKEAYVRKFGSKFITYKANLEDWDEVRLSSSLAHSTIILQSQV